MAAATFNAVGRDFVVRIDAPKIKAVRTALEFDLASDEAFERLAMNEVLLVDVLYVLCRDQAEKAGLNDVQFGEALAGDAIEQATAALLQARLDFFPQRKRSLLRSLAEKQAALLEKGTKLAITKIEDPELEAGLLAKLETEINDNLRKVLTGPTGATSSPALSESARTA